MTGWRVGLVCASATVTERINLVHRTINGPMNTFVQDAAIEALRTPDSQLHELTTSYQRRRDLVVRYLGGLDRVNVVRPRGAFYAFPSIDRPLSAEQLVRRFAEGGVPVRAGAEFGPSGEGHVRLSFATDQTTLEKGLGRFIRVVKDLPRLLMKGWRRSISATISWYSQEPAGRPESQAVVLLVIAIPGDVILHPYPAGT